MLILSPIRELICPDCKSKFETRARTAEGEPIRCPICRRIHSLERRRRWHKEHKAKK